MPARGPYSSARSVAFDFFLHLPLLSPSSIGPKMGSPTFLILLLAAVALLAAASGASSIPANRSDVLIPRQDEEIEPIPLQPPDGRFGLCGPHPDRWALNDVPRRLDQWVPPPCLKDHVLIFGKETRVKR